MTPRMPSGAGRTAALGTSGLLSAGAVSALAYAGAPWWAVTLVAIAGITGTACVGIVQSVFPQDSRDRLAWWRDYRRRRAVRREH